MIELGIYWLALDEYQFLNSFCQSVNGSLIYLNSSIGHQCEQLINRGCPCYGMTTLREHFLGKSFLVQS